MPARHQNRRSASRPEPQPDHGGPILYVITSLDVGGTERHLASVAQSLRHKGWRPAIYCLFRKGAMPEELHLDDIEIIGPPIEVPRAPVWRPDALAAIAMSAAKLLYVMVRWRPHIAHFYLPAAYLVGAPLSLLLPIEARLMSRRSLNAYQLRWPIARWLEPKLHRRMSAIVSNSAAAVRQLVEQEGCDPSRVELIYNGIDTARYGERTPSSRGEARTALGLADNTFVAVTIANLLPYKGHVDLIRAFALARANLPKKWQLLCVGRDDGIRAELERLVADEGLLDHIRFTGPTSNVHALLNAADVGVLCSHEEGFSNFVLEGMAAGLPMIVTDVGGNPEAVLDGKTGLVVPPRDPEAIGEAIVTLAQQPDKAERMGAAGRRRAMQHFAADHCISAYHALYGRLLPEVIAS